MDSNGHTMLAVNDCSYWCEEDPPAPPATTECTHGLQHFETLHFNSVGAIILGVFPLNKWKDSVCQISERVK